MDRKTKRTIQTLNQRIQKLEQQLKGARQVEDEPGEVARIERELEAARAKLQSLKDG